MSNPGESGILPILFVIVVGDRASIDQHFLTNYRAQFGDCLHVSCEFA